LGHGGEFFRLPDFIVAGDFWMFGSAAGGSSGGTFEKTNPISQAETDSHTY
jgi:hypothetical protein